MTKLFTKLATLLCFLLSIQSFAQTSLAEWTFSTEYTSSGTDPVIYSPTGATPGNYIGNVAGTNHKILPNTNLGNQADYGMNMQAASAVHQQHAEGTDVMRILYEGAFSITDFTNPANHNNYYEFSFPTTGYTNIETDFSFFGGQSDTNDFVAVVYSTDGGASWANAGNTNSTGSWGTAAIGNAQLTATNKANVMVRLICVTANDGNSNNFNLRDFSVSGTSTTIPTDTDATITWVFDQGTAGQTATYTDESLWKPDYVVEGSNLNYNNTETGQENGVTFTKFTPNAKSGSPSEIDLVSFRMAQLAGLTFEPTNIFFNCERFGTGGGLIDVVWKSTDGTTTTLATGIKPDRRDDNNYPEATYVVDLDVTSMSIPASDGESALEIYIYSFDPGKNVGIANITVDGLLNGTIADVAQYTITTEALPAEGGSVSLNKPSTVDEGTNVELTAIPNFGYEFLNWTDESDNVISTDNPYPITVNSDVTLKANFIALNTYSLDLTVNGGAADYMIDIAPEGTMVEGNRMYVEGTNVTLTASNNPILNFSNWGGGETSPALNVSMDGNKSITAEYNALDYILGWDFYELGNSGRPADFTSTAENEASTLILRQADGTQSSWLDKSETKGGYEGKNAAVNWQQLVDKFYFQISFNAADFTDISVRASMLFNYNAYSRQFCEYSLDGENFTQIGVIDMVNSKTYYDGVFNLPEDANNQSTVYIRWIPDYTSDIVGSTSEKDGTTIAGIYVFGTESILDDGTAPALISTVPAQNATGASATGKIVLNFDEKVKIADNTTALLNGVELTPEVFGKSISFNYSGLDYNTSYTFDLEANVISDLTDNPLTEAVSITFTTLNKPTVTKRAYDFIVGIDGDFADALDAAQSASSSGGRFFIFFPDGEYDLGNTTGDATQQTYINLPNISFIGQSADGVILFNNPLPKDEGIATTPTINFQSNSTDIYMQDITILNKMDYRSGSFLGRAVALRDQGDRNIYKNVKLLSNQDTFYTGSNRIYLENSEIHGTVDFIFGGGDVFFNACDIFMEDRTGSHVTAAATASNWGYVFRDCTIDGFESTNGTYDLGRPWQASPKVVFINTIMKVLPKSEGWSEWGAAPSVYAEYNSLTSNGVPIDLSGRKTTYNYTRDGGGTVVINPILTKEQADNYTISNVMSGDDSWQPTLSTEQAAIPVVTSNGTVLTWDDNNYVLGWAIFKDDVFVDFVTTNSFDVTGNNSGLYSVRAANGMGGLSEKSNVIDASTLSLDKNSVLLNHIFVSPNPTNNVAKIKIGGAVEKTSISLYNLTGQKLLSKTVTAGQNNDVVLSLAKYSKGVYLIKVERGTASKTLKIVKQ